MKKILFFIFCAAAVFACKEEDDNGLIADFTLSETAVLAGQSVTFLDLTAGQPSAWEWTFNGGTPATSDLSCPEIVYNLPGTYSVTLKVTNADGSSEISKSDLITVDYNEISVDFEADKTSSISTDAVTFTDRTAGLPTSWEWTFTPQSGAPIVSTEQNPRLTFDEGLYSVTLKASNPKHTGTLTKTDYLTVIDPFKVDAAFSADMTAVMEGATITFYDQSLGLTDAWEWTFEGGTPTTSNERNPVVAYKSVGRYKVTLKASNMYNAQSSKTIDKYILVVPTFDGKLSAFIPFNGSLNDLGPNRLTPSLSVATANITFAGADRNGVNGNVAVFDRSGGLVFDNATSFDFGVADFSVAFWLNAAASVSAARTQMMIWMESGFGTGDNQTWCRIFSNASRNLTFNIEKGGTIHVAPTANGGVKPLNGDIADGQWHFVVCTRDATGTKIFVDGQQAGSAATAAGAGDTVNPACPLFKIGIQQTATSWSNAFGGMLDDFMVFKKCLSASEIATLYGL